MMVLRANTLALGYSGVRPVLCPHFDIHVESRRTPRNPLRRVRWVRSGRSGRPLAHLALCAIGEGEGECIAGSACRVSWLCSARESKPVHLGSEGRPRVAQWKRRRLTAVGRARGSSWRAHAARRPLPDVVWRDDAGSTARHTRRLRPAHTRSAAAYGSGHGSPPVCARAAGGKRRGCEAPHGARARAGRV